MQRLDNAAELKRNLMTVLLPDFYVRAREKVLRGQMTYVNAAFARLIEEVNRLIRQVITDHLMTLHLAGTGGASTGTRSARNISSGAGADPQCQVKRNARAGRHNPE